MKPRYLFPNRYKKIGWIIFILSTIAGFAFLFYQFEPSFLDLRVFSFIDEEFLGTTHYFTIIENNLLNEILAGMLIIGGVLVAFSKEKQEDEFISKMRLESLVWAVYLNYAILFFSLFTLYGIAYYWVLVFNMFTILIIFIIRFHWLLIKNNKHTADEE